MRYVKPYAPGFKKAVLKFYTQTKDTTVTAKVFKINYKTVARWVKQKIESLEKQLQAYKKPSRTSKKEVALLKSSNKKKK